MGTDYVAEFFQTLFKRKKPCEALKLEAHHWRPNPSAHAAATGKKVIVAGAARGNESLNACDGSVEVGEMLAFVGTSPSAGFVHLFDFGTSGTTLKLGPSLEYPNNRVGANVSFKIPSPDCCPLPKSDAFRVNPPTTAAGGYPERLLVVLTFEDKDLHVEHLYPGLKPRYLYSKSARGSFGGKVEHAATSLLLGLPPDEYEYGLISLDVR